MQEITIVRRQTYFAAVPGEVVVYVNKDPEIKFNVQDGISAKICTPEKVLRTNDAGNRYELDADTWYALNDGDRFTVHGYNGDNYYVVRCQYTGQSSQASDTAEETGEADDDAEAAEPDLGRIALGYAIGGSSPKIIIRGGNSRY